MGCSRKKSTPPPPEGWDSGNSRGGGGVGGKRLWKSRPEGGLNFKKSSVGSFQPIIQALRTFNSVTLQRSQTLKKVEN